MNRLFYLFSASIVIFLISRCQNTGDNENPLYGIIYRDTREIKQLQGYDELGATIINSSDSTEFALSEIVDTLKNLHVIIFEKIIRYPSDPSKPKYFILDTINITLKNGDLVTFMGCSQDSIFNVIAKVGSDIKDEYYTNIKQA